MEGKLSDERGTVIGDRRHPNTEYGFDIVVGNKRYPVLVMQGRKPLSQLAQELKEGDIVRAKKVVKVTDTSGNILHYVVYSHDVEVVKDTYQ